MQCIELPIPPLPQLITVGHSTWTAGMQHFRRSFQVFDLLLVRKGVFYMMEEEVPYELGEGELLILEPGLTHYGHRPVTAPVEVYWLHFVHPEPYQLVDTDHIPWSTLLAKGTDKDLSPTRQSMYLPKRASVDIRLLEPVFDEMVELHRSFTIAHALRFNALGGELFSRLQAAASANLNTRAFRLSNQVIDYLRSHLLNAFDASDMERELHYHYDYLSRCLKQYTGMSPVAYLHRLQIEKAKQLLRDTDDSVQAVAEQVGQPNGNYFARLFRREVGVPPGQYRARQRELL